ncbi:MAG: ATP-dependent helicase [Propionibacteriaceae bacterium]|jgi:DNA helicase-2/ATP-dependent DNA helicase PcrA|nr:ATP-dependent helicase [Propionibacteriaceae bacterium]
MDGAEAVLAALDPEQRLVALAQGAPVAVVAGPGTGKTRALTSRIAYGVAVGAVDPAAVLAVTFTVRAAGELRDRLARFGIEGVQARTFHSAALAQAQFFWPLAFGVKLPRVADSSVRLATEAMARFGLEGAGLARDLAQEIAWTKQTNVVPERYAATAVAAGRHVAGVEPGRVADVIVEYERVKQGYGLIDFDDILLCCAAVLEESEEAARQMARRYRHLLVDEFQDVSPIQSRLVELWQGPHHDVCVVGDPAQTIHGFAGARSRHLEGFAQGRRGARRVVLDRNHRSTREIVAAANALMRGHGGVELRAPERGGPQVEWAEARSDRAEAWAAAEWLADLAAAGVAWSDMALLYRIHAQSAVLSAALDERSIPCRVVAPTDRLGGDAGARPARGPGDAVTLCTLHSAKGREWAAVGVVGAHEGLLPHVRATRPPEVEEERRLLYVGLTRARSQLRVSWVADPSVGQGAPSRFLREAGLV